MNRKHDWDRIIALIKEGKTDTEAARIVGCSPACVWNVRKENNLSNNFTKSEDTFKHKDWFSMTPWDRFTSIIYAATTADVPDADLLGPDEVRLPARRR